MRGSIPSFRVWRQMITLTSTWYTNSWHKLTGKFIRDKNIDTKRFVDNHHSSRQDVFDCFFDIFLLLYDIKIMDIAFFFYIKSHISSRSLYISPRAVIFLYWANYLFMLWSRVCIAIFYLSWKVRVQIS